MKARVASIATATFIVALSAAAVFRVFELAPGMWNTVACALGWMTLTLLAVSGVGLLVALVVGDRSLSVYRDCDPAFVVEVRHRRETLRRSRPHERQRP